MEFSAFALLLLFASLFGVISKFLKQPLIVGYILAGIFLASTNIVQDTAQVKNLAQIGVTLLLFTLGIEMNISEIFKVGRVILLTGVGQILFTSILGLSLSLFLGFNLLTSVYFAIGLTFSSTIIIVKLLSEKKDLQSLYGRVAIGVLLMQDFMALVILMFLSGIGEGIVSIQGLIWIGIKAVILLALVLYTSKKIPLVFERVATFAGNELLFLLSISWVLGFSSFVENTLGFTLEIGGFLAGLALSNVPEHLQIVARTRPLRDFFLTLFFLVLGIQLNIFDQNFQRLLLPSFFFVIFVLFANPFIVFMILSLLGYRKRTSFFTGLTFGQISEFSLILIATGLKLGHVEENDVSLLTLVGMVTMTISTYFILSSDKIYKKLKNFLKVFEKVHTREITSTVYQSKLKNHLILVGCDRTGMSLLPFLLKKKFNFVVVDFDPEVFVKLSSMKIPVVFGDISDEDVQEEVNMRDAKMIISTINNLSDNLNILERIKLVIPRPKTIFTQSTRKEAIKLYEEGATYVIVPEAVAGDYIRNLIKAFGLEGDGLEKLGENHFKKLLYA